jgi:SAM-dependent methyltransferase
MTSFSPPANEGYYGNERTDVAALVQSSALTILDIGCGKGRLGAYLKSQRPDRQVFGIEYNARMAEEASRVLSGVQVGDLQTMTIQFPNDYFDCLIFADVLEHLVDPVAVLQKVRPMLKKDGKIVCSIPNIRHYTAILQIVLRGWEYKDSELFDRTHLRFFSLRGMKELMRDGGYDLENCIPRIIASKKMILVNNLLFNRLEEFAAKQYLLVARPAA